MVAIFKRELSSYFTSPIGYVFLGIFYVISGFFLFSTILSGTTDMSFIFSGMFIVLVFLVPILTMRLLSEEKKQKTDQVLLTSPVNLFSIVIGKYLAAFTVFLCGLSITLIYALVLAGNSTSFDWLVVFGNYIGIILLGGCFIAIGLFVSSLTENQMISAIGSFAIMLALFLIDQLASFIPVDFIKTILQSISF
ncbi:MAG: ABC transporter permease, partial [Oscillospiraceae bacterium]